MINKQCFIHETGYGQIFCISRFLSSEPHGTAKNFSEVTIICPPVGSDYNNSYRNLKVLAEQLAAQNQWVITIDYLGFGNSMDASKGISQLESMIVSLTSLQQKLTQSGVKKINLIGLRFGATLAALASNRVAINKLVLWSPIVSGKKFIREIKMLTQASEQAIESPELLEISGWTIDAESAELIANIDLLKLRFHCERVLLLQDGQKRQINKLKDHLSEFADIEVTVDEQSELIDLLVDAHQSQLAKKSNQSIVSYLSTGQNESTQCSQTFFSETSLALVQGGEFQDCYIDKGRYFAIHTQALASNSDLPTFVFLNSGSNHQVGPHRLYVLLSRQFASLGFNSVRVDLPGLGESPATNDGQENLPYPDKATHEIVKILELMQLANKPIILIGLCSGAYHSMKCAAEATSLSIEESIMINPLTFFWQKGMKINDSPSLVFGHWNWYLNAMKDWRRWGKLFRGEVDIRPIIKTVQQRFFAKQPVNQTTDGSQEKEWTINADINRTLFRIQRRKVQQTYFFAEGDPGFAMLRFYAKKAYKKLTRNKSLTCDMIKNADHTFSKSSSRQRLMALLNAHITQRYGDRIRSQREIV